MRSVIAKQSEDKMSDIRSMTDLELICHLVSPALSDSRIRHKYRDEWINRHCDRYLPPEEIKSIVNASREVKSTTREDVTARPRQEAFDLKSGITFIPEDGKEDSEEWPLFRSAQILLESGWDYVSNGLEKTPERNRGFVQEIFDNKYRSWQISTPQLKWFRAIVDHYNRWANWHLNRKTG